MQQLKECHVWTESSETRHIPLEVTVRRMNRLLKVHPSLIGISNNVNAEQRFLLYANCHFYLACDFRDSLDSTKRSVSIIAFLQVSSNVNTMQFSE